MRITVMDRVEGNGVWLEGLAEQNEDCGTVTRDSQRGEYGRQDGTMTIGTCLGSRLETVAAGNRPHGGHVAVMLASPGAARRQQRRLGQHKRESQTRAEGEQQEGGEAASHEQAHFNMSQGLVMPR